MRMRNFIWLIIITVIFIHACNSPKKKEDEKNIRSITVSILPQKYFTSAIAGDSYQINVLIPPGASPAAYEPSPLQIQELSNSELYLTIGEILFEKNWLPAIRKANPDLSIKDVSKGIDFIRPDSENTHSEHDGHDGHDGHDHSGADPHIWMSIKNAPVLAMNTLKALIKTYPDDSVQFRNNYNYLMQEITRVDSAFENNKNDLKGLNFLIYHPALAYLAREYGMNQHVLEFEGKEPPPSHIRKIIQTVEEKNIRFIFVQKQFNIDNARSLARETGLKIIPINPLDENWKTQMLEILTIIKSNQKQK